MIRQIAAIWIFVGSASVSGLAQSQHTFVPKDGFIPDQTTAIRVAEAVLVRIYGERVITSERPLSATLTGTIWKVEGQSHADFGGVAEIWINKIDGRIIRVTHGK